MFLPQFFQIDVSGDQTLKLPFILSPLLQLREMRRLLTDNTNIGKTGLADSE